MWSAAAFVLSLACLSPPAWTARNLLNNGDFARGSGDSVDGWRIDAWVLTAGTTDYHWLPPHGVEAAAVEVFTRRDNDARWVQGLSLRHGWYYISVEARTRRVLPFFTGANISVLEDSIMSDDLRGTHDWTQLGFYLYVGPRGGDVDVALRLGGYMNLTRGQVRFRHARVMRVPRPPRGARQVFDLDAIRKSEATGPIGHRWTLVVTFVALSITTIIGWQLMVEPAAHTGRASPIRKGKRA